MRLYISIELKGYPAQNCDLRKESYVLDWLENLLFLVKLQRNANM